MCTLPKPKGGAGLGLGSPWTGSCAECVSLLLQRPGRAARGQSSRTALSSTMRGGWAKPQLRHVAAVLVWAAMSASAVPIAQSPARVAGLGASRFAERAHKADAELAKQLVEKPAW